MMSNFTGFSEEDIRQLHNGPKNMMNNKNTHNIQVVKSLEEKQKKINNINKRHEKVLNEKIHCLEKNDIPEEAKLSQPEAVSLKSPPTPTNDEQQQSDENKTEISANESTILNSNEDIAKRIINLVDFEVKQKQMQEQNRRRKELLTKALEDRTKKTLEEQQKLNEIQNEFKRLDANLSNDVKILRKQIEIASIDYMEAQKKYNRVEREFLDAKLNLHQKLERKEMLTEYLCAIIEKNEERKAEKLNELLHKLGTSVAPSEN